MTASTSDADCRAVYASPDQHGPEVALCVSVIVVPGHRYFFV